MLYSNESDKPKPAFSEKLLLLQRNTGLKDEHVWMKHSAGSLRVTLNKANKLNKSDVQLWSAASTNDADFKAATCCEATFMFARLSEFVRNNSARRLGSAFILILYVRGVCVLFIYTATLCVCVCVSSFFHRA